MTDDAEEPIIPDRLRPHLVTIAVFEMAMSQGDEALLAAITRKIGQSLTTAYEEACSAFRRHDLTRTGRATQLRPRHQYHTSGLGGGDRDYGQQD